LYLQAVAVDDPMNQVLQPQLLDSKMSHVGALPFYIMVSTSIFLTAIHERESEQEFDTSAPSEKLNPNSPGFSSAERESEDWNRQECDDRGTVAERPAEIFPGRISDDDDGNIDEYSHDAVRFGTSEGGYK
jgi:hypothetical protein